MVEAQVYPFKLFALLTDGTIHTDAAYPVHKVLTAASTTTITVNLGSDRTIGDEDSVFVYEKGCFGDEDHRIPGTYSAGTFTTASGTTINNGGEYEVGYIVNASAGVQRISFGNNRVPQDYFITMSTLDKDEEGVLTPFLIKAYKASVQRTWELSFSSEGDPATVTVTFDLLEDKDGNIIDMIELDDEVGEAAGMWTSVDHVTVKQGKNSANITIYNALGAVTTSIVNSSNVDSSSSFTITVSGDNDTVMVKPAAAAPAGDYTMTLTDGGSSNECKVKVTVISS